MISTSTSTGRIAIASGVLMLVGAQGEWILNPQTDNGTVTHLPALVLLMLASTAGFALLTVTMMGLRRHAPATGTGARVGAVLSITGATTLVVFGLTGLLTALLWGSPAELGFIAFLAGMLFLAVGQVTWGLSLRRKAGSVWAWLMLLLSGAAALGALAVEPDPWHDICLTVSHLAWIALGFALTRTGPSAAAHRVVPASALEAPLSAPVPKAVLFGPDTKTASGRIADDTSRPSA